MKNFTKYFFAAIAVAILTFSAIGQTAPSEVQSYVKKKGGKFPTEINKYVEGDLNGDGKADAVVQYNVNEGAPGNYFTSYIAVFVNKGGKMVFSSEMLNGSKLTKAMVPSGISNKQAVFDVYGSNSTEKTGTATYKLVGKKLVKAN